MFYCYPTGSSSWKVHSVVSANGARRVQPWGSSGASCGVCVFSQPPPLFLTLPPLLTPPPLCSHPSPSSPRPHQALMLPSGFRVSSTHPHSLTPTWQRLSHSCRCCPGDPFEKSPEGWPCVQAGQGGQSWQQREGKGPTRRMPKSILPPCKSPRETAAF